jgi:hypothetical protein
MFEIRINPASLLVSLDRSRGSQPHSFPPDPNQTINATELKTSRPLGQSLDQLNPKAQLSNLLKNLHPFQRLDVETTMWLDIKRPATPHLTIRERYGKVWTE